MIALLCIQSCVSTMLLFYVAPRERRGTWCVVMSAVNVCIGLLSVGLRSFGLLVCRCCMLNAKLYNI
jgi:hypothetical protein